MVGSTASSALPHGSRMVWLLWQLLGLPQNAHCPGEWVDVDSPESACSKPAERDGRSMTLVFSDEFDRPGRTFIDGHDARWTALESAPYSNEQVNYYNASHAITRDGVLDILCTNDPVTFEVSGTREDPHARTETRTIQTAMLQSWNKFCFSQGAVEISARMPGPHGSQEGLWPAFWMMGNLGRATFEHSTDGFWPYIFDECVPPDSDDCDANQCTSQKITACMEDPGFGFRPFHGRPRSTSSKCSPAATAWSTAPRSERSRACSLPRRPTRSSYECRSRL